MRVLLTILADEYDADPQALKKAPRSLLHVTAITQDKTIPGIVTITNGGGTRAYEGVVTMEVWP